MMEIASKLAKTVSVLFGTVRDEIVERGCVGKAWVRGRRGFPGDSVVKNLPPVQKKRVQCLGREDPLGKEMATHSSILAREIPQTEEPGGLQSMGVTKKQT